MNKEEILKELEQLKAKVEALEEKPVQKTGLVLHVDEVKEDEATWVVYPHTISESTKRAPFYEMSVSMGLVFHDKQSAIHKRNAMLLAHECRIAMAESWDGEKIDWNNEKQSKYCFDLVNKNSLEVVSYLTVYKLFAFRRKEHAQAFINKHGEDAVINMVLNG